MLVLREQLVFGQLLGQGAAALGQRVGTQVGQQGAGDGSRVDALVGHKVLVLGADDRIDIDLRQRIVGSIAPAGTDGVVHGSHRVTAGGTAVQLPALIEEPAACQQPAEQQNAQEGEQALRYKTKETMKHRKNSFDNKKERYHNKRFAGFLQEQFQYSSKFLRFYQGTEKVLRNGRKV